MAHGNTSHSQFSVDRILPMVSCDSESNLKGNSHLLWPTNGAFHSLNDVMWKRNQAWGVPSPHGSTQTPPITGLSRASLQKSECKPSQQQAPYFSTVDHGGVASRHLQHISIKQPAKNKPQILLYDKLHF